MFRFSGAPRGKGRFWLVADEGDVDVCLTYQGFEPDLTVHAPLRHMVDVWMGRRPLTGAVTIDGPAHLVRAFPRWLKLSAFAGVERP